MRYLPWLVLAISLVLASTAEARLFWQTYGSTVPAADGSGCHWNWNQDYFVPRYPSSCHYGLYSPCKSSRSTSPACRSGHPLHPGYCGIYGPCHYRRRNRVYGVHCGCSPILLNRAATSGCSAGCGSFGGIYGSPEAPLLFAQLHHVESSHLDILGSIPVEGNGLLPLNDLSALGGLGGGQPLLPQTQSPLQQLQGLPALNLPQFTQPFTKP